MKQRKSLIILIFILSFFITVGCDAKVDKTVNEKPYTTADDLDSNKKLEKNSQQKDKVKEDTPNLISGKKLLMTVRIMIYLSTMVSYMYI